MFEAFEELLNARIEGAIASGTYDLGVETLTAESLIVTDRRTIYTHPQAGAETRLFTITGRQRNIPYAGRGAGPASDHRASLLINEAPAGPPCRSRRRA